LRLDPEKKELLVVYDLRRTMRAGLERLGVAYEVCEKMLNHRVPGTVAATYARDPLIDRRRDAARLWADHLDGLPKLPAAAETSKPAAPPSTKGRKP
jgi:hypothetical protein